MALQGDASTSALWFARLLVQSCRTENMRYRNASVAKRGAFTAS
jgi:hypothetical protein